MQQVVLSGHQQLTRFIKFENKVFLNFFAPPPPPPRPFLENAEFSPGDIGDFGPGRNLRPTKTLQVEISERKLLRPEPLESVTRDVRPRGLASASRPKNLASASVSWVVASASASRVLASASWVLASSLEASRGLQPKWNGM